MASNTAAEAVRPLLRVRQVRSFTDEPVAREALDALADAARWSGSGANSQPWRFVIVQSVDTLRRIGEAGLPQTRSLQSASAAIAIVVPEESGKAVAHAYDEGRAAERILIAASFIGLGAGIAWILSAVRPTVQGLLAIPEGRFVRTIVAVGHPNAEGRRPKSPPGEARRPRSETVFYERWGSVEPKA